MDPNIYLNVDVHGKNSVWVSIHKLIIPLNLSAYADSSNKDFFLNVGQQICIGTRRY